MSPRDDQQDEDQQNRDARLDASAAVAAQLGEEWQEEEPGIYRHVGAKPPLVADGPY